MNVTQEQLHMALARISELEKELSAAQAPQPEARQIVERHRRHVELSPGVGADVQRYALAVCDDILADLPPPPQEHSS